MTASQPEELQVRELTEEERHQIIMGVILRDRISEEPAPAELAQDENESEVITNEMWIASGYLD